MTRDPLEAHDSTGGDGADCDHGWIQVKEKYAEHLADQAWNREEYPVAWRLAYVALFDSWYPCRICRPAQFYRWAKGHWSVEHDTSTCVECAALHSPKAARRVAAANPDLPDPVVEQVRRDLE